MCPPPTLILLLCSSVWHSSLKELDLLTTFKSSSHLFPPLTPIRSSQQPTCPHTHTQPEKLPLSISDLTSLPPPGLGTCISLWIFPSLSGFPPRKLPLSLLQPPPHPQAEPLALFSSLIYTYSPDNLLQFPGFKYHLVAEDFPIYIPSRNLFWNSKSHCL